ncbi:hypothetical protein ACSBR1_002512 [Camellia fascicularis]
MSEHLRLEIVAEIKKLGRVSVIDLADTIGVDLYYVEKQSQHIVSSDSSLMLTTVKSFQTLIGTP